MVEKHSVLGLVITYFPDKNLMQSVTKLASVCHEVLVLDNGTSGKSLEYIKGLRDLKNVKIKYLKSNLGIAEALNRGLAYAIKERFDWLLTFDQDSLIITDNYVDSLFFQMEMYKNMDEIAIIAGTPILEGEAILSNVAVEEKEVVITSGNLLNVNVIKELQVCFDSDLFIDYVDFDFCLSLRQKSKKIIQINNVFFKHKVGDSFFVYLFNKRLKVMNHSYIRKYYYFRNSIIIYKKYKEINPWAKSIIKSNIMVFIKTILFEKEKQKKLFAMLTGLLHGLQNKKGKYKE